MDSISSDLLHDHGVRVSVGIRTNLGVRQLPDLTSNHVSRDIGSKSFYDQCDNEVGEILFEKRAVSAVVLTVATHRVPGATQLVPGACPELRQRPIFCRYGSHIRSLPQVQAVGCSG